MTFGELVAGLDDAIISGDPNVTINKVEVDSRLVNSSDVFVAIPGFADDGLKYVYEAVRRGAIAVVAPSETPVAVKCSAKVGDIRRAIAKIAATYYDHPSRHLDLVGITGTNGKTTITWLLKSIFEQNGKPAGVIGTLGYHTAQQVFNAVNTTPGPLELEKILNIMVAEGVRYAAAEVSSHALAMYRVEELEFRVVAISNITQDHFDYHKTLESYREAKAHILDLAVGKDKWAVLNRDDANFGYLYPRVKSSCLTFAINDARADLCIEDVKMSTSGSRFKLLTPQGSADVQLQLLGKFNLENALCAAAAAMAAGIELEQIAKGLGKRSFVHGRAQKVNAGQNFTILIDYAHTPDALSKILETARQIVKNRLLVLFGCGGDRDRGKRSLMAEAASTGADIVIVTSDNPRTEDPLKIIEDIKPGLEKDKKSIIEPDRRKAIEIALALCEEGDLLVVAGKGHENYQILGTNRIHFDDREVIEETLKGMAE
ncbi:MAG: UDP-N-acetylmuramoyl-L-alanyl-D-glutamate--2,6-diaminopimelate ligase [Candidatus Zixiibacteriota bacterium]